MKKASEELQRTKFHRKFKKEAKQNAAMVVSYEDEQGNYYFLMGQNQKRDPKTHRFFLTPYRFPGGQVDITDTKIYGIETHQGNRRGAVRELMEETNLKLISTVSSLIKLVRVEKWQQDADDKGHMARETRFYHYHCGKLTKTQEDNLKQAIKSGSDLLNVKFINAKEITEKNSKLCERTNVEIVKNIMDELRGPFVAEAKTKSLKKWQDYTTLFGNPVQRCIDKLENYQTTRKEEHEKNNKDFFYSAAMFFQKFSHRDFESKDTTVNALLDYLNHGIPLLENNKEVLRSDPDGVLSKIIKNSAIEELTEILSPSLGSN